MRESRSSRHLGLDLGGTNIKWCVAEHEQGRWRSLAQSQVGTYADEGPDAVVARLTEVAKQALEHFPGLASVGVGVPGLYDAARGETRFLVNLPGEWAGLPLAGRLSQPLGLPVALINDARAFGLAELRLGAGRQASSMVGLTLGTGVGGVIAIDGRVHQGHDGTAGELGHQTLVADGPDCGCGNHGCLEALTRADRIAEACGTATVEEAVRLAREGQPEAVAGMARVGRYLGIGLANMVTVITPDVVVIGGGLSAALDLLHDQIWAEIRQRVRTTSLDGLEIVAAQLGTWAGAIGAAIHGAESAWHAALVAATANSSR